MNIPSALRLAEHTALSKITLSGSVLDLGGDRRSEYRSCFKGMFTIVTVNLDTAASPDVFHDLETTIPFEDSSFDHVLLINVLEHIFEYRQLLREAARIVRPGGLVVIAVPFLFPVHPSPHDYWRFSAEALEKECSMAGLRIETFALLGSGVFSARHLFLARLMPLPVRFFLQYTSRYIALGMDRLFTHGARFLGKRYSPAEYALGFVVIARKSSLV